MANDSKESVLDRACCCLTLRQGTILIGIISLIVDVLVLLKADTVLYKNGTPLNGFDYIILVLFGFGEIPQDLLLITAALRESSRMFQGYNKASYAFSNFYTILLVIFCDRGWNNRSAVLNAVAVYVIYCGIIGGYFLVITNAYATKLRKEAKEVKNRDEYEATSGS